MDHAEPSTPAPRIAIYGSCVTRDALALVPHPFALARYVSRTSWTSQNTEPLAYDPAQLGQKLTGYMKKAVATDLEKSLLLELETSAPDLLVIDLIDERLYVHDLGRAKVTLSSYFLRTPLARRLLVRGRPILPATKQRDELFARAVDRLGPELLARIPPDRIVLHRAHFATRFADPPAASASLPSGMRRARRMNAALERWEDRLIAALGCKELRLPEDLLVADPRHRWGPSPFHYVHGYYTALIDAIASLAPSPVPQPTARSSDIGAR